MVQFWILGEQSKLTLNSYGSMLAGLEMLPALTRLKCNSQFARLRKVTRNDQRSWLITNV